MIAMIVMIVSEMKSEPLRVEEEYSRVVDTIFVRSTGLSYISSIFCYILCVNV